jgi:hypothetical protein
LGDETESEMHPIIETALAAAIRAPSGDNTQPWRFTIDPQQAQITFYLDETRDPSPMNAGQRMARIAIGAAIENVLRTAQKNQWDAELDYGPPPALGMIRLQGADVQAGGIDEIIPARVTNRRLYEGRLLDEGTLERLRQATPTVHGVRTHWITDKDRLTALAFLIGRADALMFGEPTMRRAFLGKVRFDRPATALVEEGLSLASLELSVADRLALRLMPRLPNWLFRFGGIRRIFAAKARKLVGSASGLCLLVAPDGRAETDLMVGRCMQRTWLALTAEGLAAQPMMSLLVLENVLDNGPPPLIAAIGRECLAGLAEALRRSVPEIGDGRPAFLMRWGFAPAPTGRTGRLPAEASLQVLPLTQSVQS